MWDLLQRTHGFAAAAAQVLVMSLVLEAIGIAIPMGFQLVLDDVVVSDDRDLLTLIALVYASATACSAWTMWYTE